MMRFLPLVLLCGSFLLASCGDDDSNDNFTRDELVGTWDVSVFTTDIMIDAGSGVEQFGASKTDGDLDVTFDEDGTYSSSGTYTLTITEADSTYTETQTGIGGGVWSVDGQTVRLFDASGSSDLLEFNVTDYTVSNFQADSRVDLNGAIDTTIVEPFLGIEFDVDGTVMYRLER